MKRPPIIVIMGHVDHGKTTLLDYIRKTNQAAKEVGGITQAIGAYEIKHGGQKITLLDTPGHEAFTRMREHGAAVADLAILVIAADDSVKTQTREALGQIKSSGIPFIVAINKIDKEGADPEKVKNDLAQIGVFLEGHGGDISYQEISALKGAGVAELLDLATLATDLEELNYDESSPASGIVITSGRDHRRGVTVGVIIKNGILKKGRYITTPTASGKIKILEDCHGRTQNALVPSAPALVISFENVPDIGEEFVTHENQTNTKRETQSKTQIKKADKKSQPEKSLNFVLKADETGSLSALQTIVEKTARAENTPITVTAASVGNVIESDIRTASNPKSIVIAFRSKTDPAARNLAEAKKIRVVSSNIIYKLGEVILETIKDIQKNKSGVLEVLAVFGKRKGKNQIIGGKITEGAIKNKSHFTIMSEIGEIGSGKIINLQSNKENVAEIREGNECGMEVESTAPIAVGRKLVFPNDTARI